ncbi:hypothetical protein B4135_3034 [Caldibacillus debilis]|uniref:Uncharacterized protein n=1 Tax=Caldibacillus debilis TaxID=301148 RepID=A0A150LJN5_9BACI|nr:hypothetical protein B4135_3034 [Caldibacillus debilis]
MDAMDKISGGPAPSFEEPAGPATAKSRPQGKRSAAAAEKTESGPGHHLCRGK